MMSEDNLKGPNGEDVRSSVSQDAAVSSTDRFYEDHAVEYFSGTSGAQTQFVLDRFLSHLPANAAILDAGCGSGRDLKYFHSRGHCALGIDASTALVQMAAEYSGAPCEVVRIERISYEERFDGVWACASLLHLPRDAFRPALRSLNRALKRGGTLFMAVQEGQGEAILPDGRLYVYYSEDDIRTSLDAAGLAVNELWTTRNSAEAVHQPVWINVIATAQ
ncbi:SAM-dependent methyltransferase [Aquabacterium olei]|jgi:SAM-dependent methyltransferase|uniref:SAM-dependent methyltransferase n=1 Tax=Aquabacterium olei TaxID=1296669 RepID=A0A2U8FQZ5_9BURK|nr:class I SAM-dependent methyltransferase [Aquabacterium olei]AWI53443.1 SAM-dependent methyltransferase [Aquabacterium olei]